MVSRRGRLAAVTVGGVALLAGAGVAVWQLILSGPGLPTVPDAYRPAVESAARACPVLSVPLLAAQIDAESNWQPDADSGHAQGISQFAPVTWSEWGRDANGDGRTDIWDPEDAIPSQARYMCHLHRLVKDVPGDPVELTLAAYNAGPNAVLAAHGVPQIHETQGYVDRIVDSLLPQYRKSEARRASDSPTPSSSTTPDSPSPSGSAPSGEPSASGGTASPVNGPAVVDGGTATVVTGP